VEIWNAWDNSSLVDKVFSSSMLIGDLDCIFDTDSKYAFSFSLARIVFVMRLILVLHLRYHIILSTLMDHDEVFSTLPCFDMVLLRVRVFCEFQRYIESCSHAN